MPFPTHRPRRLRRSPGIRRLVREHTLDVGDFISPIFLQDGKSKRDEIPSMPGVARLSVDLAVQEARELFALGVSGLMLFGVPPRERKDEHGSEAWSETGLVQVALREIKSAVPGLVLFADACFCEYTEHGHCGVLHETELHNDASLSNLARVAVSQAKAGADFVAPSGMLDGMVGAIRKALDESGFEQTGVMAYAVKYASAFYGPFRDAADSTPAFGDRRAYQMDPPNLREALREAQLDEAEGADWLMVKPALAYLDVLKAVREQSALPLACYNVSGEYSMLKAAALKGWIDEPRAVLESLTGMKRAGADAIITYWARDAVKWMKEQEERERAEPDEKKPAATPSAPVANPKTSRSRARFQPKPLD